MQLDEAWEIIDGYSSGETQGEFLEKAYQGALSLAEQHERPWECWQAASRAAYLLKGRGDREYWESACLAAATQALACRNGFLPAVLCLLHLWIDQGEISRAAPLAFTPDRQSIEQYPNPVFADWFMEARVYCLAELGLWQAAETEMIYFERRRGVDPSCGMDLINFFRLLDSHAQDEAEPGGGSSSKNRVLSLIKDLVNIKF